jgi:hypothetical protein
MPWIDGVYEALTDVKTGLINRVIATSADVHDSQVFALRTS